MFFLILTLFLKIYYNSINNVLNIITIVTFIIFSISREISHSMRKELKKREKHGLKRTRTVEQID